MLDRKETDVVPQLQLYRDWLRRQYGLDFDDYASMWAWSTSDLDGFWRSVWAYHDLQSPTPFTSVVSGEMPNCAWFTGAQVNYARQIYRHAETADAAGQPAIVAENESGEVIELSWTELRRRSISVALELRRLGVERNDRVAAYLPNIPEAVVALLACASIGAIWTLCSPDMGKPAVLDRFRQVKPKVLIAVDSVHYGGRRMDRTAIIEEIRDELPSVIAMLVVRSTKHDSRIPNCMDFGAAQAQDNAEIASFEPEWLPFDHPLWILYSSGTTGLPKAIVHRHGGMILSGCLSNLQFDIGPSYAPNTFGERFHWYSSTGWVMWNIQVGGLLTGTTICLFDGSPSGLKTKPDWRTLWTFAARHRVTWFGAGAAFYSGCRKAELTIADAGSLGAVRALGSTGSPLPTDVQLWGTAQFEAMGRPNIWWCNVSGGTDIVLAFLVGNRQLPPTPGRLQCRHLGAAVEAWDEEGRSIIGQVGELVCTRPLPSMPVYFWCDEDGSKYRSSYFSQWEGIWRHGDWLQIEADGSCIISGRSDATINRQGLRMGTAEIYAAVENLTEVADSLVIDLEDGAGGSTLLMFVVPRDGLALDADLKAAISTAIRTSLSPRFVPDIFVLAPAIPRTLSGKKQELPLKRLFQGWPVDRVINKAMIENPEVIPWYQAQAKNWLDRSQPMR
jgi:acetoacetyl-CoA synthetase